MKRILLVVLVLLSPVILSAQQSDIVKLGLKIGPNISFGTGDTDALEGASAIEDGSAATIGIGGGGFIEIVPFDFLSIELDVLLSFFNYGMKVRDLIDPVTIRYTALEMPLFLKGRLPTQSGAISLGAGPDFIVLLGDAKVHYNNSTVKSQPDKLFHVALAITGGYEWLLASNSTVSLELRYFRGFSSPLKNYDINVNRFDLFVGWAVNL